MDTYLYYNTLINNFLSIASLKYFDTLSLENKLSLLNTEFGIKDLVSLVINSNYELDVLGWMSFMTELYNHQYHNLALEVASHFINTEFTNIKEALKSNFYSLLGNIYANLRNYELALEAFQKAYDYVDKVFFYSLYVNQKIINFHKEKVKEISQDFRRALCLMNIGRCYHFLHKKEEMRETFHKVREIEKKLKSNSEKFRLNYNLSIIYKTFYDFVSERNVLNEALNLVDETVKDTQLKYIEERTIAFESSNMDTLKLIEIENINKTKELIKLGEESQKCFNFEESIDFFTKALEILKKSPDDKIRFKIFKKCGFSYLRMSNWVDATNVFEIANKITEDFEVKLYLFLCQYRIGEDSQLSNRLREICISFRENSEYYNAFFRDWILDMVSFYGMDKFRDFILFLEREEYDDKWKS